MRHLTFALALAFAFGAAPVAYACSYHMKTAQTPTTVVQAEPATPPSTKIVVPSDKKS